ncbi:hypothetical protein AC629_14390 [Bradyrhizobium sp. NAS80.1]|nr:hypothetical protein AC629_14390 [Bradyrhizobium sp. NAS80.1]
MPINCNPLTPLELSPLERRPRGGWRIGIEVISNAVVARLIASRRAETIGNVIASIIFKGRLP